MTQAEPHMSAHDQLKRAEVAFAKYDKDSSGTIDKWELQQLLTDWGLENIDREVVDKYNTDEFTFEQFVLLHNELQAVLAKQRGDTTSAQPIVYKLQL